MGFLTDPHPWLLWIRRVGPVDEVRGVKVPAVRTRKQRLADDRGRHPRPGVGISHHRQVGFAGLALTVAIHAPQVGGARRAA